jgi:hypothetical protein
MQRRFQNSTCCLFIFLAGVSVLGQEQGTTSDTSDCQSVFASLRYPPLARLAHINGVVDVRKGSDGLQIQGHNLFTEAVRRLLHSAVSSENCKLEFDQFRFSFELNGEPSARSEVQVSLPTPRHVVIFDRPSTIICAMYSEPRKSWFERLWQRLR